YVITADAKIVQVIEGKDKKRDQVVVRIYEVTQKNDYGKEEYEEDKIDGPLKSSKDNDLEKNLSRDEEVVNLVTQLQ
ncbi:5469_t:CDS:2, partial [Rhizophagus irregularis]